MKLLTRNKKERYAFVFTEQEFINILEAGTWEINFDYKGESILLNQEYDVITVQKDGTIKIEFDEEDTFTQG